MRWLIPNTEKHQKHEKHINLLNLLWFSFNKGPCMGLVPYISRLRNMSPACLPHIYQRSSYHAPAGQIIQSCCPSVNNIQYSLSNCDSFDAPHAWDQTVSQQLNSTAPLRGGRAIPFHNPDIFVKQKPARDHAINRREVFRVKK
jgi:hypothetical protein